MLAEFNICPLNERPLSRKSATEILERTGLAYQVGPMGTCVEGEWDKVLDAVRRCHQAIADNHDHVVTTIVIDDCKDSTDRLPERIARERSIVP